jgi:choline dehydrogenase-like flavoprotein
MPTSWFVQNRPAAAQEIDNSYLNLTPAKPWLFTPHFGGGSNCWWGCTPRMLPEDFALQTTYGVGTDWPFSYSDLESYYCIAEEWMGISGYNGAQPAWRSRPYPLGPHRLNAPDEVLHKAYPDTFIPQPTARASQNIKGGRGKCCANGTCSTCPVDAKFTIHNSFGTPYEDPRVQLLLQSPVRTIRLGATTADGVQYQSSDGAEHTAFGNLIAIGANALFTPQLLEASGDSHTQLGKGLVEQVGVNVEVLLDGLDNFSGSTSLTGNGYMLYAGAHRATKAAALIQTINVPQRPLRMERGKWRQKMEIQVTFEDLRQAKNHVRAETESAKPVTRFEGISAYTQRGLAELDQDLNRVLSPLPVENIQVLEVTQTEGHIMGTTMMGTDPLLSVADHAGVHHRYRNLVLLGSGLFPTAAPANPTLTLSAMAIRTADWLQSSDPSNHGSMK